MKYHAPTKQFTVSQADLEMAAMSMKHAIKSVRELAGLPPEPHKTETFMQAPQFAEQSILDAAKYLGIDLGTDRHGRLDVRDPP